MTLPKLPLSVLLSLASVSLGCSLFVFYLAFVTAQKQTAPMPLFPQSFALPADALQAKAAIVYDPIEKRVLYQKNADESLPLASLTKLMTAQAVLASVATDTIITITSADLAVDGDNGDIGFAPGDKVQLDSLIKYGLVASSNDAMAAAAAAIGSEYLSQMNKTAGTLGLTHTLFLDPTGLDLNQDISGAYGSASDVAKLAATFLQKYPQYFELTTQPSVSIQVGDKTLTAAATDAPLLNIPGFIGAKTGYTDLAGGNLVAAFDVEVGHPLIAVVLGSSEDGRFSDIRTIIDAARDGQNIHLQ